MREPSSVGTVIPIKDEDYEAVAFLKKRIHERTQGRVYVIDDTKGAAFSGYYYNPGAGSLGGSIVLGLGMAQAAKDRRVITIDAGGSHDPQSILPLLLAPSADVVIGSRFVPGGTHEGPWWRSVGSRVTAHAFNLRCGTHIRDWTSGYRVYSDRAVAAIRDASPQCKRHAVQAEMLGICVEAGLTVVEVPIRYTVGSGSTFNRAAVAEIVRLWWSTWR